MGSYDNSTAESLAKNEKKKDELCLLNPVISSKLLIDNINREIFDSHLPKNVLDVLESGLLVVAGVNQQAMPDHHDHGHMNDDHCKLNKPIDAIDGNDVDFLGIDDYEDLRKLPPEMQEHIHRHE